MMNTGDIIRTFFLILIMIGGISFVVLSINVIYTDYQDNKLCNNHFEEEYTFFGSENVKYWYEKIDEDHYNCCRNEIILKEEGSYEKEKMCKGFER